MREQDDKVGPAIDLVDDLLGGCGRIEDADALEVLPGGHIEEVGQGEADQTDPQSADLVDGMRFRGKEAVILVEIGGEDIIARQTDEPHEILLPLVEFVVAEGEGLVPHVVEHLDIGSAECALHLELGDRGAGHEIAGIEQKSRLVVLPGLADLVFEGDEAANPGFGIFLHPGSRSGGELAVLVIGVQDGQGSAALMGAAAGEQDGAEG